MAEYTPTKLDGAAAADQPAVSGEAPLLGVDPQQDDDTVAFMRRQLQIDGSRQNSMKATIAKTIICVILARSWIYLTVLVRPVVFGQHIEVGHEPNCTEAVSIMIVTVGVASSMLLGLTRLASLAKRGRVSTPVNKVAQGLGSSAAMMWAGSSFSPMFVTCFELFTLHEVMALSIIVVVGATISITALTLHEALLESMAATRVQAIQRGRLLRNGKAGGAAAAAEEGALRFVSPTILELLSIALPLFSIFVVIATAAVLNDALDQQLAWTQASYLHLYVHDLEGRVDVYGHLQGIWLPNPAVVAISWALAIDGVLTRAASTLTVAASKRNLSTVSASVVLFFFKLLAFLTGFQYLTAISVTWTLLLHDETVDDLGILMLEALTVVVFAIGYIVRTGAVEGAKNISRTQVTQGISREQAEKTFHDTTVGQALGVSFTPLAEGCFKLAVLAGGALEARARAAVGSSDAAAHTEAWEVGAGIVYVVLVATPLSAWLYYTFILTDAEKKVGKSERDIDVTGDMHTTDVLDVDVSWIT